MALSGSLVLGVATCETIRQSIPEDCTRVVDEACGNEKAPGGPHTTQVDGRPEKWEPCLALRSPGSPARI
jgi:hypothetical protein